MRRHPIRFAVALAVVVGAVFAAIVPSGAQVVPTFPPPRSGGDINAYRGLGTWVDIFDSSYSRPRRAVRSMAKRGVRTLYLETSNFSHHRPFVHKAKVAQFLDAAAAHHIHTVAWYLPSFRDVRSDFHRAMAAIDFTTRRGNGFDSFGLDIESPEVRDASVRTRRLLRLSASLRSAVGSSYPLGAIIPSPYGIAHAGGYWPRFPYVQLTSYYDVVLPMSYSTWRVSGLRRTQWYTARNVQLIRQYTGNPTFPIHVIGGIANRASVGDTKGFVRAVRERGVVGASFYTFPLTRGRQWRLLRHVPANPVESPALPAPLTSPQPLGNIPHADHSHPKEVFFTTGGKPGAWSLAFDAFDVQKREVQILVNWRPLGYVAAGPTHGWTGLRTRRIPDRDLAGHGTNVIAFVAKGNFPDWSTWGVRSPALHSLAPVATAPTSGGSTSPSPTP